MTWILHLVLIYGERSRCGYQHGPGLINRLSPRFDSVTPGNQQESHDLLSPIKVSCFIRAEYNPLNTSSRSESNKYPYYATTLKTHTIHDNNNIKNSLSLFKVFFRIMIINNIYTDLIRKKKSCEVIKTFIKYSYAAS